MKGFSKKESEELIIKCYNAKREGKSLTGVFKTFANENARAFGSVRNYYYKTVSSGGKGLLDKLEIKEELKPSFIKEFSYQESFEIVKAVLNGLTDGVAARKTFFALACGNEKLALRYQNKYRNCLKSNKTLVLNVISEIEREKGKCYNPYAVVKTDNEKKIEAEINLLIEKIYGYAESENAELKCKLNELSSENKSLKNIIKNRLKKENLTKEYFYNFNNEKTV